MKVTLRQLGPGMIQQLQTHCPSCQGEGQVLDKKDQCKTCQGRKLVQEKKILEVHIDKGMKHGQKIVFSGEGDQAPGLIAGDVVIVLEQKEHPTFKRDDQNNLIMEKEITLVEALCGFTFVVNHLDGRKLLVNSDPARCIKPGDLKEISNEGMPTYKRPYDKGALIIRFSVKFPDSVAPEQARALEAVLPPPPPLPRLSMTDVEEVILQDYNPAGREQNNGRREAYDDGQDDDDDRPRGATCAQQ